VVGKNWQFLEQFMNKRVQVLQKDGFIKDGILRGFDESFVYVEFFDSDVAISKDMIVQIKLLEGK